MILLTENKEKKELTVIVYSDCPEEEKNSWVQAEIQRFTEMGYCINSVVFPIVSKLPQEAQEVYNAVYHSKGNLDSLINAATDDLLSNILAQVVRSEISKYDVRDIAENVVDYETSMGLSPQSKE